jgi:hypothetical protein
MNRFLAVGFSPGARMTMSPKILLFRSPDPSIVVQPKLADSYPRIALELARSGLPLRAAIKKGRVDDHPLH